ncbi:MAG: mRNA surveillance protein pelota [Halobacteria archaeon]|nr:mRNA surveillance protein pelota [Halobacteria archaeon]
MNVQERNIGDDGYGTVTLVPETLDDLWHLKYIVEDGDVVSGLTERRIERVDETTRADTGTRETMHVDLRVEDVEFHRFSNRLRVSGVIESCGKEREIGSHHTLNVEINKEMEITKTWKPDQLQRLEEAEETVESDVVVVTVEEGEAHIHTVEEYGIEERTTVTSTTGKGEDARPRQELFGELLSALKTTAADADAVILAGPGFTKKDALDYIEENAPSIAEKIVTEDVASVGARGVHEVLKRGTVEKVAEEARISRESRLIDELMERISTDGAAAYGLDEVEKAVDYGAVETLLVVDEALRDRRDEIDPLIRQTEQKGGDVTVFSSDFDPGKRLDSLGGIAALLRYKLR